MTTSDMEMLLNEGIRHPSYQLHFSVDADVHMKDDMKATVLEFDSLIRTGFDCLVDDTLEALTVSRSILLGQNSLSFHFIYEKYKYKSILVNGIGSIEGITFQGLALFRAFIRKVWKMRSHGVCEPTLVRPCYVNFE